MSATTFQKLEDFKRLEQGWCYGEGGPISESFITLAKELILFFNENNISLTDAFPGLNGEVMVTGYYNEHYIELTIESDESITLYYTVDDLEVKHSDNLSFDEAKRRTKALIEGVLNV